MHFFFADQEALVKQPVQEFLRKQLTASIKQKKVKPATNANHVFHLMKEHR